LYDVNRIDASTRTYLTSNWSAVMEQWEHTSGWWVVDGQGQKEIEGWLTNTPRLVKCLFLQTCAHTIATLLIMRLSVVSTRSTILTLRDLRVFKHSRLLGHLCAKVSFFLGFNCWASPWRKIVLLTSHSISLFDAPGPKWKVCRVFI